jgi:RimJ/RimL family protein N-acetyltransferase
MGFFSDKPTITGERVLLRPFTAADIEAMGPILADPEVLRLTGSVHSTAETLGRSPTLDERTRQWYESRAEQPDRLDLAVVDRTTGRCVGEVVLNDLDDANDRCGFRILLGPAGRGRGLGTEAIRLLLDHAFATTPLQRIELAVHDFNPRARHVYERAGFVHEGTRRAAFKFDGTYLDEHGMAVLRSDRA